MKRLGWVFAGCTAVVLWSNCAAEEDTSSAQTETEAPEPVAQTPMPESEPSVEEPVPAPQPEIFLEPEASEPNPEPLPSQEPNVPAPEPMGEQYPEDPLAVQNQWGPAARIVRLTIPNSPAQARQAGCLVHGSMSGTGLGSLILLAGGLDQFVEPDADGLIQLLLLLQAEGWTEGQRIEEVEQVDLSVWLGHSDVSEGYFIAPDSFAMDDPTAPRFGFPSSRVDNGWLESAQGNLVLGLTVVGLRVHLALEHVQFSGRMFAEGDGFGVRNGVMTGYISREGALSMGRDILANCEEEEPPPICSSLSNLVPPDPTDDDLITVIGSVAGEFDARLEGGSPYECASEECNALGVCFLVEMEGTRIEGTLP